MRFSTHLPLLFLASQKVAASFLGPTYPPPRDLTSKSSLVRAAWTNLTSTLDGYFTNNNTPAALAPIEEVTWSTGLFSLHDPEAVKLQYHHLSEQIRKKGPATVDGDTIYRIASVSKLFTVLIGLMKLTNEEWYRPLNAIIPGLSPSTHNADPIYTTPWSNLTPWALATHLSGIARQGLPVTDLLFLADSAGIDPTTTFGLPPLPLSVLGPCLTSSCEADEYIASVRDQAPVFAGPWHTPAYANNGFILLGLALSKLLGTRVDELYGEIIFAPLGMTDSSAYPPTDAACLARSIVLPGWEAGNYVTIPSGGLLSTTNDLAKFGTALLNATLLSPEATRRWMKPQSHTASLTASVGAAWEIHRWIDPETEGVVELYTKSGDAGNYGAASTSSSLPRRHMSRF